MVLCFHPLSMFRGSLLFSCCIFPTYSVMLFSDGFSGPHPYLLLYGLSVSRYSVHKDNNNNDDDDTSCCYCPHGGCSAVFKIWGKWLNDVDVVSFLFFSNYDVHMSVSSTSKRCVGKILKIST